MDRDLESAPSTRGLLAPLLAALALLTGCWLAAPGAASASTEPHVDAFDSGGYRIQIDNGDLIVSKGRASTTYGDRSPKLDGRHIEADLLDYGAFDIRFHPKGRFHGLPLPPHCHGKPSQARRGIWKGAISFRGEDDYVTLKRSRIGGSLVKPGDYRCGSDGKRTEMVRLTAFARDERGLTDFQALAPKAGGKPAYLAKNSVAFREDPEDTEKPFVLGIERKVEAGGPAASFKHDAALRQAEVSPTGRFSGTGIYSTMNKALRTHGFLTGLSVDFLGYPGASLNGKAVLDQVKTDGSDRHAFSRG